VPKGATRSFRSIDSENGKDALALSARFRQTSRWVRCTAWIRRAGWCLAGWLLTAWLSWGGMSAAGTEIVLPQPSPNASIQVRADRANRWTEGSYEVWMLRGNCQIVQDQLAARGENAILWILRAPPLGEQDSRMLAYFEDNVVVEHRSPDVGSPESSRSPGLIHDRQWFGCFYTSTDIDVSIDTSVTGFVPEVTPALYQRGRAAWDAQGVEPKAGKPSAPKSLDNDSSAVVPAVHSQPDSQADSKSDRREVRPVQYTAPQPTLPPPDQWPAPTSPAPTSPRGQEIIPAPAPSSTPSTLGNIRPTARRILIRSRGNVRMQGRAFTSPDGRETVAVVTSGVNVIVDGIENVSGLIGEKLDIEADRIVIWTAALDALDLSGESSGQRVQPKDAPLEFYIEGNIVFREGDRVIYAERMYYNVPRRSGMVLNAEVLTPAPGYPGLVRLKADVLQQIDEQNFRAFGASVTSSRLGVPRYWFQAETVEFQDRRRTLVDPISGVVLIDPETGDPAIEHEYLATSRNNFVYGGGVPLLYWPVMATNLEKPSFYLDQLRIRNDDVFGFQIYPDWDLYQVLGIRNAPTGTEWTFSTDWLSDRGFALGTDFRYDRFGFLNIPGPVRGDFEAWGINDSGLDNLGLDRRAVVPATENRGRVFWQHRQELPRGFEFTGQASWISDRNFLEQYYLQRWDEGKDEITGVELKQYLGSQTWSVHADVRLNDFFSQTEWLPRANHFVLGASPLDYFTWSAHTHVGYAQLRTAELPPLGAEPPQVPLPWETDLFANPFDQRRGVRAATRHELGLPLSLGPVRVVPFALGELGYWDEDRDAAEVQRAYGQVGIRGSLPFWSVNPGVRSLLWNVNGVAHKVTLDAEFFWAGASEDVSRMALYDPLDDDATEHFQRRFIDNLFGGMLPREFDARYYALRSGMQRWVTSPTPEIANDLAMLRSGIRQRWQTKRGSPGSERIIDWIVFDVEGSFFPDADRDNFGEAVGLLNYNFRWHVGDRLTLLSDGFADLFTDGLRTFSLGGTIGRPLRGSLYVGYRSIHGPFNSDRIMAAVNYRMSEKWILNAGGAYDLTENWNLGESVSITRVGESMLIRLGAHVDRSRDNVGIGLAIEPRFMGGKLSQVGGVPIPPVGAFGLE
jgi:hypothetical protein